LTWLLDANVLIALSAPDHMEHKRAKCWFFSEPSRKFASCPITQGALLRFQLRFGRDITALDAWGLLTRVCALPNHEFWPDNLSYDQVVPTGILGHRQVTDSYLVALAKKRNSKLATMNEGLAAMYPMHSLLIPRD
jgi:uncharacterized protein